MGSTITVNMQEDNTAAQNQAAWNAAIAAVKSHDRIVIPPGIYDCDPIVLQGPLHSLTVDFYGSLVLPNQAAALVSFETIERSRISINGLACSARDWDTESKGLQMWGSKTNRIRAATIWDFTDGLYMLSDNQKGPNESNHMDVQNMRDCKRGLSIKNGIGGDNNCGRFTGQIILSADVQPIESEAHAVYFDPDCANHPYVGWTIYDCVIQRHIHAITAGGIRYGSFRNNYIEDCNGLYYQNFGPYCRLDLNGQSLPDDKHEFGPNSYGLVLTGRDWGISMVSRDGGMTFIHPQQQTMKSVITTSTLYQCWGVLVDIDGNSQKLDGLHGGATKHPTFGSFAVGARWWRKPPVSGQPIYVTCTQFGTMGTLDGVTGTINAGTRNLDLVFAGASSIADFRPGHVLLIGAEILVVDHVVDADTLYMTANATNNHAGDVVARRNPTWKDGPLEP